MNATADTVYALLEEKLSRRQRALSWAGSLAVATAFQHMFAPRARQWYVVERASGEVVLHVTDGFDERRDLRQVLETDLAALSVEEFQERWLPEPP